MATITVRSGLPVADDGAARVVLWERDPAHPGGEAYVAGETPVTVGRTPTVERLLREGTLVAVEPAKPAKAEASKTPKDKAPAAEADSTTAPSGPAAG